MNSHAGWAAAVMLAAFLALCLPMPGAADPLVRITLPVRGEPREALIALPPALPPDARGSPSPLVFAFHGHGGTMASAARRFRCESFWPEAIVAYPQGLPTPGGLVDPEGRLSGWQANPGDQGDRDLAFFDALLEYLKSRYRVDERRIYALGHSNGGLFAYGLWAARGEVFAAIGAMAAIIPTRADRSRLKPMPVFHAAGRNDPLVRFGWQMESIEFLRSLNLCGNAPLTSRDAEGRTLLTYPSPIGCEVATYIDDGGHEIPAGAIPAMMEFFKRHTRE